MLCQNCGKNEAVFHYKSVVNNSVKELHLCAECASRLGMQNEINPGAYFGNAGNYFNSLLSSFMGFDSPETSQNALKCPLCGATENDIARTGKAGCANCYKAFADLLNPYIKQIHGNTQHNGKIPSSAGSELILKRKIEELKNQMNKAVEVQNFESAAKLRDQIKGLEGGDWQ